MPDDTILDDRSRLANEYPEGCMRFSTKLSRSWLTMLLSLGCFGCELDPSGFDESMRRQLTDGQASMKEAELPVQRAWSLAQIAEAQLYFRDREAAEAHAKEALALLHRKVDSAGMSVCEEDAREFDPLVYHRAHIVLGRLALRRGDRASAKEHLLESAHICKASGVLSTFGPDQMLAKELLLIGERATVIQYFAKTEVFWTSGVERARGFERAIFWGFRPELR